MTKKLHLALSPTPPSESLNTSSVLNQKGTKALSDLIKKPYSAAAVALTVSL